MTEYETIEVDQDGRVRIIRFNRPEKLNAFNDQMAGEFGHALDAADRDPGVGAIVATGNGRAYSSGNDRTAPLGSSEGSAGPGPPTRPDAPSPFDHEFLARLKPIVAAVNGIAMGVGLTAPLHYDSILASTEARFSMRFAAIGSVPELGSSWMLPKVIGLHRAKEMVLTGRIYSAQEALELGLVRRLVEPDQLLPQAVALAQEMAANPESTLRTIKRMLWEDLLANGDESTWRRSTENITAARKTAEYREGILAFAEKRPPRYHDAEHMAALRAQFDGEAR